MRIYIVYGMNVRPYTRRADFKPENFYLKLLNLLKTLILYFYLRYGVGYDTRKNILLSDCRRFGKKVKMFGADMSS